MRTYSLMIRQVSQYGLYDALSDAYKKFVEGLHAVHTSRLQCEWICSCPFQIVFDLGI